MRLRPDLIAFYLFLTCASSLLAKEFTTYNLYLLTHASDEDSLVHDEQFGDFAVTPDGILRSLKWDSSFETRNMNHAQHMFDSPTIRGGGSKLYEPIFSRELYPVQAQEAKVEGDVVIRYIVNWDLEVWNVEVLSEEPSGWGLGHAAIRVIERVQYTPGRPYDDTDEYPVRFERVIKFRLEKPSSR